MRNPLTSRHTFGRLMVIRTENGAILSADHHSVGDSEWVNDDPYDRAQSPFALPARAISSPGNI
jgi:hypothetical protein